MKSISDIDIATFAARKELEHFHNEIS